MLEHCWLADGVEQRSGLLFERVAPLSVEALALKPGSQSALHTPPVRLEGGMGSRFEDELQHEFKQRRHHLSVEFGFIAV